VHVLDTHGCDGVHSCAPRQVGFWHGSDGNIYASDFWLGFFFVNPN
jgi:hypothetical protein